MNQSIPYYRALALCCLIIMAAVGGCKPTEQASPDEADSSAQSSDVRSSTISAKTLARLKVLLRDGEVAEGVGQVELEFKLPELVIFNADEDLVFHGEPPAGELKSFISLASAKDPVYRDIWPRFAELSGVAAPAGNSVKVIMLGGDFCESCGDLLSTLKAMAQDSTDCAVYYLRVKLG